MSILQLGLLFALVVVVGCCNILVTASWGRAIMKKLDGGQSEGK
jgi:hypothetical protein